MSFVAPLWLAAAGLVGAGVLIAHLFSSTVPPQDVLPTVHFIPESTPLAVMRSRRVTDWLLLLLRLLVVALLGLALSGAHLSRRAPQSVVLIDASRATGSMQLVIDSALAASSGSEFVVFDSAARRATRDEVKAIRRTTARGSLSAGLVAAHRVMAGSIDDESTQLVIVSPSVREEQDSAVRQLIDLWRGPIRVIRVPSAAQPAPLTWEIRASGDDPVAASLSATPNRRAGGAVRVVRSAATSADSLWASAGGTLVVWPADGRSLTRRVAVDSQGGLAGGGHVVVAQFQRGFAPASGKALVRWMDGEPAATERIMGRGCIRDVAIPVDGVGDVALRESFRGLARSLLEPCGGAPDFHVVQMAKSELSKPGAVVRSGPSLPQNAGQLPLLLALLAAVSLAGEQLLRRRALRTA